jgi:hypothetical protein
MLMDELEARGESLAGKAAAIPLDRFSASGSPSLKFPFLTGNVL